MTGMLRSIERLRGMPPAELASRAGTFARHEAERVAWAIRAPAWRRMDLARSLDTSQPGLRGVADDLMARRWTRAHEGLSAHFVGRTSGFVMTVADRAERARTISERFPGAASDAARRADRVLAARFDLLGYRDLCFASPRSSDPRDIEWHRDPVHGRTSPRSHWTRVPFLSPACGDHKIIWEVNRHQHWLALGRAFCLTGDRRYRDGFVRQLNGWLEANPPLTGINWASMLELSLRSLSWIWALHFFAGSDEVHDTEPASSAGGLPSPWTVDLLLGLERQLTLVACNLSTYFSPNTHLLGEGLALYVAGRSLPELRRSSSWQGIGRRILVDQIDRQINADGGHVELSLHYHRYALDFYLLALAVAQATGDHEAVPPLARAAERLAHFAREVADDDGRLPRIGDDDGGMLFPVAGRDADDITDSLSLAAQLLRQPELGRGLPPAEEVFWLTTPVVEAGNTAPERSSTCLGPSGYVVCRSDRGDHLVMDVGRLGFLNGGHAHADALSVTLSVAGRPLLIDPGTGCYTIDPEVRDRFRSTRLHNTLEVDGQSQSHADGPFRWRSAARSTLHVWQSRASFDFVEASHDGYSPLVHRRAVLARPGCWVVVDWILGPHPCDAAAHWHLAPAWTAHAEAPGAVRASHPCGARAWILSDGHLDLFHGAAGSADLGWCAPAYGPLVPTTTLRTMRRRDARPVFVTAIVDAAERPELERLSITDGTGATARGVALRLTTGDWTDIVMAAYPGDSTDTRDTDGRLRAGGRETNARFACVRLALDGAVVQTCLVDGDYLRRDGEATSAGLQRAVSADRAMAEG